MKPLLIAALFIATVFISCSKNNGVKPANSSVTIALVDTAALTRADNALHTLTFNVNAQQVITSVSGDSIKLKLNENVDLIYTAAGYQQTSAIHLIEKFSNTLLQGFDFTTVAENGNTTLNWVDDNLNNVILKSTTDTVINNVNMVKINVHRQFIFFKVYDSNTIALNEQTIFINRTDDIISFSSYCYYNLKNYPPSSITAKVVYSK